MGGLFSRCKNSDKSAEDCAQDMTVNKFEPTPSAEDTAQDMTVKKVEPIQSAEDSAQDMTAKKFEPPPRPTDPALAPILDKWGKEQEELKKKLIVEDTEDWAKAIDGNEEKGLKGVKFIGGVDISFVKGDDVNACAAYVVLEYPALKVVYQEMKMIQLTAPYIPGYLAFRETPDLEEMINRQREVQPEFTPDVIMVDGNGVLHYCRFGLACHLGVLVDMPCMGVAKTLFHVDGIQMNPEFKDKIKTLLLKGGDQFPLVCDSGELLGYALRAVDKAKNPVYISAGHKMSLDTAVTLAKKCSKYKIPEPTRQADLLSREYLRDNFKPETENED